MRTSAKLRITPNGDEASARRASPSMIDTADEMRVAITNATAVPHSSIAEAPARFVVRASVKRRGKEAISVLKAVQPRVQAYVTTPLISVNRISQNRAL
jgi:hypothetical protein